MGWDLNPRSQVRRGVLAPLALTTCIPTHGPSLQLFCVRETEQKGHVLYPDVCGAGRSIRALPRVPLHPIYFMEPEVGLEPTLFLTCWFTKPVPSPLGNSGMEPSTLCIVLISPRYYSLCSYIRVFHSEAFSYKNTLDTNYVGNWRLSKTLKMTPCRGFPPRSP